MKGKLTALFLLGVLGIVLSLYLTYVHYAETYVCGVGDCDFVNKSVYSEIFGVPVAFLSFLVFVFVSAISLLGIGGRVGHVSAARLIFAGSLVSLVYASYLQYIEFFVLEALCVYCTGLYGVLFLTLALSVLCLLTAKER
ncbi:MAG: hypothetical protein GTN80_05700 [Nitrososphaeria archaeon]|nr:hypothetical protein [Nitrososphaeria archaeon]NIN52643.1 hypothetical protein [Nitrososphaeria archaeon]NIQ33118.1 hypothetical protein [Nitrososphaeria archaeon]